MAGIHEMNLEDVYNLDMGVELSGHETVSSHQAGMEES
jgi:hypothetical protein